VGKRALAAWESLPQEVQKDFDFLDQHRDWVLGFWQIQEKLVAISLILKIVGYSLANDLRIKKILGLAVGKEDKIFSQVVLAYLATLSTKIGNRIKLYCCSDVIESGFGKLKQKLGKNNTALSSFIFTLASIGGQYHCEEVRKALENIREKDLTSNVNSTQKRTESQAKQSVF